MVKVPFKIGLKSLMSRLSFIIQGIKKNHQKAVGTCYKCPDFCGEGGRGVETFTVYKELT